MYVCISMYVCLYVCMYALFFSPVLDLFSFMYDDVNVFSLFQVEWQGDSFYLS